MGDIIKETAVIIKYNVIYYFRYPANIIWMVGAPVVFSIIGLLLVNLLGADRFVLLIGGNQSGLSYVLVGFAIFSFSNFAWQSNGKIEGEKVSGTAKINFTLPMNKISYIYGMAISGILTTGIFNIAILLVVGLINKLDIVTILVLLLLFLSGKFMFLGISLIISSISLAFTQLGSLTNIVTFALQMVTGMIIPLRAFPSSLEIILRRMPTSLAIDSIRSQLLNLIPMDNLEFQIVLLITYAVVFNVFGYYLCKKAIRRVKIKGSIDVY